MTGNSKHLFLFGNNGMKIFRYLRLCTVMLLLTLTVFSCGPSPETSPKEEPTAPDFTLRDLEGNAFHLQAERGKMVLIIFTTTWCPSCRESIPTYRDIHQAYGGKGLVVVNVDIQEPLERVNQFVKTNQIPYRVLLDEDGTVGTAYGIVGVPSLMLINQDGETISSDATVILDILVKMYTASGQSSS
jgi:peroxiredoxin